MLLDDPTAVEAVVADLADDVVNSDGTIGAIAAITRSLGESCPPSPGLRDRAGVALRELRSRPAASEEQAAVLREAAVLALLVAVHDHDAATVHADRMERYLAALDPAERVRMTPILGSTHLIVATTHAVAGEMYAAERVLGLIEADRHGQRMQEEHLQRAYICAMRGEVSTASDIIEEHIDRRPRSIEWSSRLALTQAIILLETGQLASANEVLESLEPHPATSPDWANIVFVITRAHVATDPERGVDHVDRLLAVHGSRPMTAGVRDLFDSGVADLALAAGDVRRAVELIERRTPADVALRVVAARIGLVTGDLGYLDDLRQLLDQTEVWIRRRVHALFLLAVGLHRTGSPSQAHDALDRALVLARQNGIRLIQSLVPRAELDDIAAQNGLRVPSNVNDADPLADLPPPVHLTKREQVLLRRLASGALLREIADAEFVALPTIKSQAASLYRKLGVHSRHEAIDVAHRRGALP